MFNFIRLLLLSFRDKGILGSLIFHIGLFLSTAKFIAKKKHFNIVMIEELREVKKSDTIFIFGSGASLLDISDDHWREISLHNTMGFNFHFRQRLVDIDYHMIREFKGNKDSEISQENIDEFKRSLAADKYLKTIYIFQKGWFAEDSRDLLMSIMGLIHQKIVLFKSIKADKILFNDKMEFAHGPGTITDCINFATIFGWKKIVLVGVDLYNRDYFWLKKNEVRQLDIERGASINQEHNTVSSGLVEYLNAWSNFLQKKSIILYVYNEKSLLSEVLPVFRH